MSNGRGGVEEIWANIWKIKGGRAIQNKHTEEKRKGKATKEGSGKATPYVAEVPPRRAVA